MDTCYEGHIRRREWIPQVRGKCWGGNCPLWPSLTTPLNSEESLDVEFSLFLPTLTTYMLTCPEHFSCQYALSHKDRIPSLRKKYI